MLGANMTVQIKNVKMEVVIVVPKSLQKPVQVISGIPDLQTTKKNSACGTPIVLIVGGCIITTHTAHYAGREYVSQFEAQKHIVENELEFIKEYAKFYYAKQYIDPLYNV